MNISEVFSVSWVSCEYSDNTIKKDKKIKTKEKE